MATWPLLRGRRDEIRGLGSLVELETSQPSGQRGREYLPPLQLQEKPGGPRCWDRDSGKAVWGAAGSSLLVNPRLEPHWGPRGGAGHTGPVL